MHDEQQQHEGQLDPELAAFERQLATAFAPKALLIDRDRLMFEAGRAAAQASQPTLIERRIDDSNRFWPVATFAMTAATLLLATMLVWQNHTQQMPISQPATTTIAKIDVLPQSNSVEVEPEPRSIHRAYLLTPDGGFPAVRYIALTRGLNALDQDIRYVQPARDRRPDTEREKPATARELLDELIPPATHLNRPNS